MDPLSESSSSSDEMSDEENSSMPALADLLWHKVRKNAEPQKEENSSEPSPSTSKIEPPFQNQLATKHLHSPKQFQVDIGNLLGVSAKGGPETQKKPNALMKSRGKQEKKSNAMSPLIQSRMQKDLKKISVQCQPSISEGQRKKTAKLNRSQWSLGKEGWGSMRMAELTEERKQDLMVLNMRSTIDPTRHYKHGDVKTPKFFQIGTVQEDHYGFYHDRIPKKKRKRTLVEELMADQDFKRKLKKQYDEVQSTKTKRQAIFQGRAPRKIKKKNK